MKTAPDGKMIAETFGYGVVSEVVAAILVMIYGDTAMQQATGPG